MKYAEKMKIVLAAAFCVFAFSGCYTKIASYQNETAPHAERCEDCVEERTNSRTREICVWERDLFGFAHLRCYNSNYSSSWFYFHNTPWWYRNKYRWYETRGCPPHYYYDRVSGGCRYYGASRPRPGHSGGSSGSASSESGSGSGSARRPQRELPGNVQNSDESVPILPGSSTKQLSPVGASSKQSSSSNKDALSKDSNSESKKESKKENETNKSNEEKQQNTPSRRTSRGR